MYDNPKTTLNPLQIFIIIAIVTAVVVIISVGNRNKQHISITKMDFVNTQEDGKEISSDTIFYTADIRYIAPRITYNSTGNDSGEITINVKIINPLGNIMSSSPGEYTYDDTLKIQAGKSGETITLSRLGDENRSTYSEGIYTCEIWSNGEMLYGANFTVTAKSDKEAISTTAPTRETTSTTPPPANTIASRPATVTGVSIEGGHRSLERGGTQKLRAIVYGTNNPSQEVVWTVTGGRSGTGINPAGALNIAVNETVDNLTVRATSKADSSKSGTIVITVTR
jgi:hypothetical protein